MNDEERQIAADVSAIFDRSCSAARASNEQIGRACNVTKQMVNRWRDPGDTQTIAERYVALLPSRVRLIYTQKREEYYAHRASPGSLHPFRVEQLSQLAGDAVRAHATAAADDLARLAAQQIDLAEARAGEQQHLQAAAKDLLVAEQYRKRRIELEGRG